MLFDIDTMNAAKSFTYKIWENKYYFLWFFFDTEHVLRMACFLSCEICFFCVWKKPLNAGRHCSYEWMKVGSSFREHVLSLGLSKCHGDEIS